MGVRSGEKSAYIFFCGEKEEGGIGLEVLHLHFGGEKGGG